MLPSPLTDLFATIQAVGIEKIFLLLMAPVFIVCMAAEYLVLQRRRPCRR